MSVIVAAEHFELTPAIRTQVDENLERIEELLPEGATVRVFLSISGPGVFTALFRVHLRKQEIVCKDTRDDLYVAITHAATQVRKKLLEKRRLRIDARRVTPAVG